MKNLLRAVFALCCVIVLLMLLACGDSVVNNPAESITSVKSRQLMKCRQVDTDYYSTPTGSYYNIRPYTKTYVDESGNSFVIVMDKTGKEFYRELDSMGMFAQLDENTVVCRFSGGNGMGSAQYFDVEWGLISPFYLNSVTAGYGKVAYLEGRDASTLVVRSMFDPEIERVSFVRDFCTYGDIEVPQVDYFVYPFTKAEFLDANRLHIKYLTVDDELNTGFAEEILVLN